jgi:hypothetical protein
MNSHEMDQSVRCYRPELRDVVLSFLEQVDDLFVPPLSSVLRQGSLEKYLEYSGASGQGRILLYFLHERVVGFLAYRHEPPVENSHAASVYLSNMCVTESLMGTVLIRLFRAMVRQVESECVPPPQRIWAKTWLANRASARTLQRLGLQLVQTIHADPVFRGCRETLVFAASWQAFVENVRQLSTLIRNR